MKRDNVIMKRLLCVLMCFIMTAAVFTGCDDDSSSMQNVEMEDLPYGSTLRELSDSKIKICFDSRYFSDDAMKTLSDYFYALETQDVELFKKTLNTDYVDYLEKNGTAKLDDYLKAVYEGDTQSIGDGLKYTYIEVIDAGDSKSDTKINEISELMDNVYSENNKKEKFSDSVKDAKYASLSVTGELNGKSYTNTNHTIYVFECEDGTYIFN